MVFVFDADEVVDEVDCVDFAVPISAKVVR